MQPQLLVVRVGPIQVPLPAYQTAGAAGMDLSAALEMACVLQPGSRRLISTGLKIQIPVGYEAQVRPRSGLALRHGVTVLNSPGTIDSDYRGEVSVVLVNLGQDPVRIEPLQRIAQLVVAPVALVDVREVEQLATSDRGQGGYGSTGL